MSKHDKGSNKKRERQAKKLQAKEIAKGSKEPEVKEKQSKKKIAAFILVPLGVIYFAGVYLFTQYFTPHTTFKGYDFSLKKPEVIAETMEDDTVNRTITLIEREGEEIIHLNRDLDYVKTATPPEDGWIDSVTPWIWPMYLFANNELKGTLNVEYSEDKITSVVESLDAMKLENRRSPKDAHLEREGDIYIIVPEDNGTELIKSRLVNLLKEKIPGSGDAIDLDEEDCYTRAYVTKDDPELTETLALYKAANFQHIDIDMTGITETLETPDIISMYEDGKPSREKVEEYVQKLKDWYDTYERQRPFINHYGSTISVGTIEDTYGFKLDLEATTDLLYELLQSKDSTETRPIWTNEAWLRTDSGSDIPSTYIEVCINEQALWAYYEGELVLSTNIVSGRAGKFDTPRGVFRILNKQLDVNLKGEIDDEEWDSPVDFWMPINWTGIGLHNAPWRSSFGGGIYVSNGSHGCINLNYSSAEYLFNNFSTGTPVIVW